MIQNICLHVCFIFIYTCILKPVSCVYCPFTGWGKIKPFFCPPHICILIYHVILLPKGSFLGAVSIPIFLYSYVSICFLYCFPFVCPSAHLRLGAHRVYSIHRVHIITAIARLTAMAEWFCIYCIPVGSSLNFYRRCITDAAIRILWTIFLFYYHAP